MRSASFGAIRADHLLPLDDPAALLRPIGSGIDHDDDFGFGDMAFDHALDATDTLLDIGQGQAISRRQGQFHLGESTRASRPRSHQLFWLEVGCREDAFDLLVHALGDPMIEQIRHGLPHHLEARSKP
jgi:hypothetical protein